MNIPLTGVPLNRRLLKLVLFLLVATFAGCVAWPRLSALWGNQQAIANITPRTFHQPEYVPTIIKKVLPIAQPTATPKAAPTPCQPCQAAAQEVLNRYVKAIRDGAGADDRTETNAYAGGGATLSIPQYNPANHPVFVSDSVASSQLRPEYQR